MTQPRSQFSFTKRPGRTDVRFDGQTVISFWDEDLILRSFRIANVRLRPGGPVEFTSLAHGALLGMKVLRAEVACDVIDESRIRIEIVPTKVMDGLDTRVRESRRIEIVYLPEQNRFRYDITVDIEVLKDVAQADGLWLAPLEQWGGDDYAVVEVDDPYLSGGCGPAVPMTQDWVNCHEPIFWADGFTTAWRRRFVSVSLPTVERGVRRLPFNRTVNGVQSFYNRHVLKTDPGGAYVYEKTDGRFVRFTPHYKQPAGHHICEWGFDMHLYALVPRPGAGLVFAAGQKMSFAYSFDEISDDELPAEYRDVTNAELDPAERERADQPIYEEPACRFTATALDAPDAYAWEPRGECRWNRCGGSTPGTGALEIDHGSAAGDSSWRVTSLGPSHAANPIPPGSTMRVTACVKADELDRLSLSLKLMHHQGPGMWAKGVPVEFRGTRDDIKDVSGDWALLVFEAAPTPPYVLTGTIEFAYEGKGRAAMSDLRVERL